MLYTLFFKLYEPSANADNLEIVPLFIVIGLLVAYPVTLILGLPISLILQKYDKFKLQYLSLIVLVGTVLSILISGGGIPDFIFVVYFSLSVSTFCWYLYRVGW